MSKALRYLGIARKAGFLELGEENTGAAVRGSKAKVVFLAADASDNARRRAEGFVYGKNIPLLTLPDFPRNGQGWMQHGGNHGHRTGQQPCFRAG